MTIETNPEQTGQQVDADIMRPLLVIWIDPTTGRESMRQEFTSPYTDGPAAPVPAAPPLHHSQLSGLSENIIITPAVAPPLKNRDTPENAAYWDHVERVAADVRDNRPVWADPAAAPPRGAEPLTRWQVWGDNDGCRAIDPDGEWVRYEDVIAALAAGCPQEPDTP